MRYDLGRPPVEWKMMLSVQNNTVISLSSVVWTVAIYTYVAVSAFQHVKKVQETHDWNMMVTYSILKEYLTPSLSVRKLTNGSHCAIIMSNILDFSPDTQSHAEACF